MIRENSYLTPASMLESAKVKVDEDTTTSSLLTFFNDAVSKINNEMGYINLPFIEESDLDEEYIALSRNYATGLIITYISYLVKVSEEDINESNIQERNFYNCLVQFRKDFRNHVAGEYIITEELEKGRSNTYKFKDSPWACWTKPRYYR